MGASGSVSEKEKVAVKLGERSVSVDERFQFVTNLYVEHVISSLTNNELNTKLKTW